MKKIIIFLFCLIIFINNPNGALATCSQLTYNSKEKTYSLEPCKNSCEANAMTAETFKGFLTAAGGIPLIINQLAGDPLSKTKLVYECWPIGPTKRLEYEAPPCPPGMVLRNDQCCVNDPMVVPYYCEKIPSTPSCPTTFRYKPNTNIYNPNKNPGTCVEVFPEDATAIKIIKPTSCDCVETGSERVCSGIETSLGCFPTDPKNLVSWLFTVAIGVGGGIAFLIAIYGAFLFMTSGGDPEKLKEAQATLTASITGILLIIFSVFLLRLIGVTILRIPGWG